ncbi:hypothetical protein DD584_33535, partial [Klebsiella pneumoniae]
NKSKQHLVNIPPGNLRQSSLLCHGIATNRNEGEGERLHYAGIGVKDEFKNALGNRYATVFIPLIWLW